MGSALKPLAASKPKPLTLTGALAKQRGQSPCSYDSLESRWLGVPHASQGFRDTGLSRQAAVSQGQGRGGHGGGSVEQWSAYCIQ